jgi:hypothetical protein
VENVKIISFNVIDSFDTNCHDFVGFYLLNCQGFEDDVRLLSLVSTLRKHDLCQMKLKPSSIYHFLGHFSHFLE